MVQREAAERYLAPPGTKARSAVSVFLQSAYTREPGHRVAKSCFFPAPAVDSALLKLSRKDRPYRFVQDDRAVIRSLFVHRRKQLGRLVRGNARLQKWLSEAQDLGVQGTDRPEDLPLEAWMLLGNILNESKTDEDVE